MSIVRNFYCCNFWIFQSAKQDIVKTDRYQDSAFHQEKDEKLSTALYPNMECMSYSPRRRSPHGHIFQKAACELYYYRRDTFASTVWRVYGASSLYFFIFFETADG